MRILKSRRRQIYYIKKTYQKLFMMRYMKMLFFGAIGTNLAIYFYEKKRLTYSLYRAHVTVKNTSDIILTPLIIINAAVIVLSILLATYLTIKSNGKLGKNLGHLSAALRELGEGNLSAEIKGIDCKLLGDFFRIFNRVTAMLRGKKMAVQTGIEKMEDLLSGKDLLSKELVSGLSEEINKIEEELKFFKFREM